MAEDIVRDNIDPSEIQNDQDLKRFNSYTISALNRIENGISGLNNIFETPTRFISNENQTPQTSFKGACWFKVVENG